MTQEELLRPRVLVIADWPDSHLPIGGILTPHKSISDWLSLMGADHGLVGIKASCVDRYPHLFKKLEWHEGVEKSDLPEYVKCIQTPDKVHFPNNVYKVQWGTVWGKDETNSPIVLSTNCYLPATAEDYKTSLKQTTHGTK